MKVFPPRPGPGATGIEEGFDVFESWGDAVEAGIEDAAAVTESIGTPRMTASFTDPLWSEILLTRDYRRQGGTTRAGGSVGQSGPGWVETASLHGDEQVVLTRDFRRVQPAGEGQTGGLTPQHVLDEYTARMPLRMALTAITGWGDSMTTKYGSTTVNQTLALAAELGATATDYGISGDTPFQVAWRMGALDLRVTLEGGLLPASGAVPVTMSRPNGWNQTRNWLCSVRDKDGEDVQVILRHAATTPDSTPAWTIEQATPGVARTIQSGTRIAHEHTHNSGAQASPATIWVGRNDLNAGRVEEALQAIMAQQRDPFRRVLVRPVFNATYEPAGSGGYDTIMGINAVIKETAGQAFFDDRTLLIKHGLSIMGIPPTPEDTTAIAEDRVPPSLMLDALHLNDAGRLALARIDANEILGRNWK